MVANPRVRPIMLVNFPKNTRWPNMHEWAFATFAFLTWKILEMIRENPALLAVPSFMQFTQTLATGGVLAAAAWLWSSNKAKEKEDEKSPQIHDMNVKPEGDVNIDGRPI